jgi:hypothetical protein
MRPCVHIAAAAALLVACGGTGGSNGTPGQDSGTPSGDSGGMKTGDSGTGGHEGGSHPDSGGGTEDAGDDGGGTEDAGDDGGSGTEDAGDGGSGDGAVSGPTCGSATLFAGNPNFSDPSERPSDGDNILSGTPYLYQALHFMSGGEVLTNDQLSVWRIDTGTSELHAVAGGSLLGDPELLAGAAPGIACSSARFADILGSAVDSKGNLFVADYANAILKVSNPLDASTCTVSYFAGTATEVDGPSLDQTDGNSGTADGTGSAADFTGPQFLTIDDSDNLYVLDHATAWSIRKITPSAVVSTIATFSDGQYPYAELQYLKGTVWFWARGNDTSDADTANLIAIDPTVTSPVKNPPSVLTLHGADLGGDSSVSFDTGGITTDGTKLYVEALGQIFSIDVSGSTPVLSAPLAGENDSTWDAQDDPDFASGYHPAKKQTAKSVELLALDNTDTWGVDSYLSRDSSGNLYFTAEYNDVYVEQIAGCP